jgi:hypothetical protein
MLPRLMLPSGILALVLAIAGPAVAVRPAAASPFMLAAASDAAPADAPESSDDAAEDQMLDKADIAGALGQIEAHLRAAKEMAAAGKVSEAEAHLVRARDVFYPEIADGLTEVGVPSLAEPLAATNSGEAAATDAAIAAVAAAREDVGKNVADKTRFAIKVAVALLFGSSEEYATWLDNPGSDTLVDYQGARATAQLAAALVEPVKADVATRSADSAAIIATSLAAILRAFPDATPPAKAVVLQGDMNAAIYAINEAGEGF